MKKLENGVYYCEVCQRKLMKLEITADKDEKLKVKDFIPGGKYIVKNKVHFICNDCLEKMLSNIIEV